jgi:hypothetical protein
VAPQSSLTDDIGGSRLVFFMGIWVGSFCK